MDIFQNSIRKNINFFFFGFFYTTGFFTIFSYKGDFLPFLVIFTESVFLPIGGKKFLFCKIYQNLIYKKLI